MRSRLASVSMSATNMWSDDSDVSLSTASLRAADGQDSSSTSQGSWAQPNTVVLSNTSRSADMDMDQYPIEGPLAPATQTQTQTQTQPQTQPQPHFFADIMFDDELDEWLADEPSLDILAVTNVLTQGIDVEAAGEFSPAHTQPASLSIQPPANIGLFTGLLGSPMSPPLSPLPSNALFVDQPPASMAHHASASGTQQIHAAIAPQNWPDPDAIDNHQAQMAHPGVHHPTLHLNAMSFNPNATPLGPENHSLPDFLRYWAYQSNGAWHGLNARERGRYPWSARISTQMARPVSHVDYDDLEGDRYDVQGIDWEDLGVTRNEARERRLNTYKNYVNIPDSDRWQTNHDMLPCRENYFRFRRFDARKNINLAHFQLRNVLASTSRTQVFYPGQFAVHEFNPITGKGKVSLKSKETPNFQVSTLAADHGILVAGGFFGEYSFRRLAAGAGEEVHEGTITTDNSGITNHVQLHMSRTSASPRAAFASNDNGFRVLDIETEKFVSETVFPRPINCSAISPDGRLRVMVGDQKEVLITKAEADGQPEILKMLSGHGDFGFACDWADDGWTVATGFQDKSVKIWDARRWTDGRGKAQPVCTLGSEIAGVRSLRFSPLGSGKRVLVAAEEADFVNIYDARTFQSKQTFDFFGEIGGVSFANEGQDLHVLCCDRARGGLFQLERCGLGAERSYDPEDLGHRSYDQKWKNGSYDWQEFETTPRRIPRHSETRRRRRALAVGGLDPF